MKIADEPVATSPIVHISLAGGHHSSATVYPPIQQFTKTVPLVARPRPQPKSVLRKLARIFLLAWGVLCFYSALRILVGGRASVELLSYFAANFVIGSGSWILACWQS